MYVSLLVHSQSSSLLLFYFWRQFFTSYETLFQVYYFFLAGELNTCTNHHFIFFLFFVPKVILSSDHYYCCCVRVCVCVSLWQWQRQYKTWSQRNLLRKISFFCFHFFFVRLFSNFSFSCLIAHSANRCVTKLFRAFPCSLVRSSVLCCDAESRRFSHYFIIIFFAVRHLYPKIFLFLFVCRSVAVVCAFSECTNSRREFKGGWYIFLLHAKWLKKIFYSYFFLDDFPSVGRWLSSLPLHLVYISSVWRILSSCYSVCVVCVCMRILFSLFIQSGCTHTSRLLFCISIVCSCDRALLVEIVGLTLPTMTEDWRSRRSQIQTHTYTLKLDTCEQNYYYYCISLSFCVQTEKHFSVSRVCIGCSVHQTRTEVRNGMNEWMNERNNNNGSIWSKDIIVNQMQKEAGWGTKKQKNAQVFCFRLKNQLNCHFRKRGMPLLVQCSLFVLDQKLLFTAKNKDGK